MSKLKEQLDALFKGKNWSEEDPDHPSDGNALWCLISTLRGPDNMSDILKQRTSLRIRLALHKDFFVDYRSYNSYYYKDIELPDKPLDGESKYSFSWRITGLLRADFPDAPSHFLSHYVCACWAYWKVYACE